jgi:methylmalonyl-CoA mutase cobalamin-binding subunit
MPAPGYAVIAFRNTGKSINSIMGNMKRFMAYEIVERLAKQNRKDILQKLAGGVNAADKKKGQLHQVFEPSFDAKDYYNDKNIL